MTLSELKTTLLSRLSAGSDSSYYDSTSLVDIIKGGQIQLANFKPWSCLMIGAKRAGGTVKDQNNYGVPVDYLMGASLWLEVNDKDYEYVSFQLFKDDSLDLENRFTFLGTELLITPTPTENGLVIEYWYVKTPKVLSVDDDVSDFPDIFKETLITFCLSIAKGREGDKSGMISYLQIAEKLARNIWRTSSKKAIKAGKISDIADFGTK